MDSKKPQEKIINSIYEAIGNTPMVRLQRIPQSLGIECEILVKCEFMNPGGSVKDRIGREMFDAAEKEGIIKPGDTIIEATSGNAGIGQAFVAACKGYNMVITLPEKMSNEKVSVLHALGAEIIRTPTEAATFAEDQHYMVARKIEKERENAKILDQYGNPNNPLAHERGTGQEIFDDCGGKVDYVAISVGTGGTITGSARRLKKLDPKIKMIGIDPHGSIFAQPESLNTPAKTYHVEGIGYDFIPDSLDRSVVDHWVKTDDQESFDMARRLIAEEGLLVGGSGGATLWGLFEFLKQNNLTKDKSVRCVVVLADGIRNYLTKFAADEWMVQHGFSKPELLENKKHPLYGKTTADLDVKPIPHFDDRFTIDNALDAFDQGVVAVPIIEDGKIKGIVTRDSLLKAVSKKNLKNNNSASKALTKDITVVDYNTDLTIINALFKQGEIVFVKKCDENGKVESLYGVTKLELIKLYRKMTKVLL